MSQLITSLTVSTTCPLEKTFLGSSALWMARRKSLLIVRLCRPSLLFIDLKSRSPSFQMLDMIPFCSLPLANHIFQYFITIVPTKLNTYKVSADTHQYSVTEQVDTLLKTHHLCALLWSLIIWTAVIPLVLQDRAINHAAGSHGVSGIFMKYDISSLMVKVTEQHMPLWQFLVRLCGIIGGIFSTTGRGALSETQF